MKVYCLVGKSGTGKSYQAMNLCKQLNIETIIDDGLLIGGTTILAGISAKRQATKIGAIKTALFTDGKHRDEVEKKLKEVNPKSLLIIGTSDAMIEKIIERLHLPPLGETIYIDEITTQEERNLARKQRQELGKHVIPVPTLQLKREFSGYFMDPLKIFRSWGTGRAAFSEKSVVRPTYSYLGDYSISDRVVSDIVVYLCTKIQGVSDVSKVNVLNTNDGIKISIFVIIEYGYKIVDAATLLQIKVAEKVEEMTAFNIAKVDIIVKGISRRGEGYAN